MMKNPFDPKCFILFLVVAGVILFSTYYVVIEWIYSKYPIIELNTSFKGENNSHFVEHGFIFVTLSSGEKYSFYYPEYLNKENDILSVMINSDSIIKENNSHNLIFRKDDNSTIFMKISLESQQEIQTE